MNHKPSAEKRPLLRIENLKKYYPIKGGIIPILLAMLRQWTVSASRSVREKRLDLWENQAVENPP